MSKEIQFRFVYQGKLAGEPYEVKPFLSWWSSTNRSAKKGTARTPIEWQDEKGQVSKKTTVSVPLTNSNNYRLDDHIWVQAVVHSPTEEGFYVGARAGAAKIRLKDIYDKVVQSGTFKQDELNLVMAQMTSKDGRPYLKGRLSIELVDDAAKYVRNWSFPEYAGPYDLVKENTEYMSKILNMTMMSALFPYTESAEKMNLEFRPSVQQIESIHAPIWIANQDVPGWAYWVDYSEYEPDELFMENLAKISLDRYGVSRDWFLKVAEKQLKIDGDEFDEDFLTVVAVTMNAITIPSVSLYYKSDESYTVEAKKGFLFFKRSGVTIKKRSIESFNDPLNMQGDDCEGLGALIHRVFRIMKKGIPSRKGNDPWNKDGGWKDPVLKNMQNLAYWYVSGGALGSVTAARVGGAQKKLEPLIIDSREDRDAKLGAHMWQESIPVPILEERMKRTNESFASLKLRRDVTTYPKWLHRLPYTVGEGTGAVHPFLRSKGEYYTDKVKRENAIRKQITSLNNMNTLVHNTRYIRMGQIQRLQKMITTLPDARLSDFYRRTTTFHTDELLKEGFATAELVWVQLSSRISEEEESEQTRVIDEEWTWGANMRDKLRHESPSGKKLGLATVPPITDSEMEVVRSLLRQLPPLQTPTLSPERKNKMVEYAEPFITEFQKQADLITRDRSERIKGSKVNVIFRKEEFFRGMINQDENISLRDALLDDIENMEEIYKVNTVFEPVTNNIYNVRLEVFMNTIKV